MGLFTSRWEINGVGGNGGPLSVSRSGASLSVAGCGGPLDASCECRWITGDFGMTNYILGGIECRFLSAGLLYFNFHVLCVFQVVCCDFLCFCVIYQLFLFKLEFVVYYAMVLFLLLSGSIDVHLVSIMWPK